MYGETRGNYLALQTTLPVSPFLLRRAVLSWAISISTDLTMGLFLFFTCFLVDDLCDCFCSDIPVHEASSVGAVNVNWIVSISFLEST